jgi:type IV pilus assembly protein PilP
MIDYMRPMRRWTKPSPFVKAVAGFSLLCCFGWFPFHVFATETQSSEKQQSLSEELPKTPFEYRLENRPDPFVPFITEKAASSNVNMDEIVDSGDPLTGMQLFEPGQLTVVALVKTEEEYLAMVQDFTGKGYTLSQGMKIGRHGVVKSFTPQSVIVEETTVTRAGKKSVTEVVMLLKKEGEK